MRNFLLSAATTVVLFGSSLFATVAPKAEDAAANYTHRIVGLQPALSYDRLTSNSMYFGFESYIAPVFRGQNDPTTVGTMELRVGYNYAVDDKSSVIPVVGVSMFRDLGETTVYVPQEGGLLQEGKLMSPYFFHGTIGLMGEYNFTPRVGLGLTAKALIGSQWGSDVESAKDLSYGFHGSMPVTFRFGANNHWDFRVEPFTTVLVDYAAYVGLKNSVGYRF